MAGMNAITIPLNFELTDASKIVLKPLIAGLMREALEGMQLELELIPLSDDVRAFIRAEVHRALDTRIGALLQSGETPIERT